MYKRVIMTEKRNAAEDIAKAIGLKEISRQGESKFIHGFNEDGDKIVIVWTNGHCLELSQPEQINSKYKKWKLEDLPLPLVSDQHLIVRPGKKQLLYDIRTQLRDADDIVNAGDAGREGELIQRWVLSYVLEGRQRLKKPSRLWVQSMTQTAIQKAYRQLLGVSKEEQGRLQNLYDSGRARAIMDQYMGYNYSRAISLTQTDGMTVNYGRCKSPLVHAIVERDREIERFVSVPYECLYLLLEKDDQIIRAVLVDDQNQRRDFTESDVGEMERIRRSLGKTAVVSEIDHRRKYVMPPQPFDTLQIQKLMASKHGYDADFTLQILERLYDTYKILSYPRTEARYYTTDLKEELKELVEQLAFGEFKEFAQEAAQGFIPDKYFNDKKIADHHALMPTIPDYAGIAEVYQKLSEEERNVYRPILQNFIALHLPNNEYEAVEVLFENNGNYFLAKGRIDLQAGFRKIYVADDAEADGGNADDRKQLPVLQQGERLKARDVEVKKDKTKPKPHFTTASLLDYMKVHNIGTGATRDTLIKELTLRKGKNPDSAVRREGKLFIATPLGREMDMVIPSQLKSIDFLKRMEKSISDIAEGKLSYDDFILAMRKEFAENLAEMKANPSKKMSSHSCKIREDLICPVCGSPMMDVGWGYSCSTWKKDGSGCNLAVGKKQFNKTLSDKAIGQLLHDGRTKVVFRNLKGRSGKPFNARLALHIETDGKGRIVPIFERNEPSDN